MPAVATASHSRALVQQFVTGLCSARRGSGLNLRQDAFPSVRFLVLFHLRAGTSGAERSAQWFRGQVT